jgi:iron complex outermembrane receptor protein
MAISNKTAIAAALALAATGGVATPTWAEVIALEEIVVSARKRDENLQDLPDSITVFSSQTIEDARITEIADFAELTPNLDVFGNFRPNLAFVSVRGLITPQVGEPPLAFVVDGVTVPNLEFINQGLHDIERIEVLRGPQGALYGKNAIGGAINIVTKQPSDETEGSLQATFAEGDDMRLAANISGALVEDAVYYRLSGFYRDSDGLIDDKFLNEGVDYIDQTVMQGMLRFQISDQTTLDLRGSYSDGDYGVGYYTVVTPETQEDFSIEPAHNVYPEDENSLTAFSIKLEHDTDYGLWSVVAGYNKSDDDNFLDADFTPLPADPDNFFFPAAQRNVVEDEATSMEVRFVSPGDEKLRWLVGGFYQQRDRTSLFSFYDDLIGDQRREREDFTDADLLFAINDEQESEAWAAFGQLNYDLSDTLELTAALRYDEETRESFTPGDKALTFAEETFSELQPKFSLAWQATENLLTYVTYSHGFRSGGFNEFHPDIVRTFNEEISDTYEIGIKSEWFDGRMTLNAALFQVAQDDAQFTGFNPITFTLENLSVDEVEVRGFELELNARPTEGLSLTAGAGFVDNEINRFERDLSLEGNTMPFVPEVTLNAAISYEHQWGDGLTVVYRASANYKGETDYVLENIFPTDSYTFVDLSVKVEAQQWSATLFVDNATDEDAIGSISNFGLPYGIRFRNTPQQAGVQLRYNF